MYYRRYHKTYKPPIIVFPYTIIKPFAMVIELIAASIALDAMFRSLLDIVRTDATGAWMELSQGGDQRVIVLVETLVVD